MLKKITQNFLDPNSEKALSKALQHLNLEETENSESLIDLVIDNQEKLVESPLIDQISDLSILIKLYSKADEALQNRLEALLSTLLSQESMTKDLGLQNQTKSLLELSIKNNDTLSITYIAFFCNFEEICKKALEALTDDKTIYQLLLNAKSDTTKTLIAKNTNDLTKLKSFEKELKGKDKKIHRIVQDKIESIEVKAKEKNALQNRVNKIIESAQKLAKSSYAPLYESKLSHIEHEWLDIESAIENSEFENKNLLNEDNINSYQIAIKVCQETIDIIKQAEFEEQQQEQTKLFLNKSLEHLKAFLCADKINNSATQELIDSIYNKLKIKTDDSNILQKEFDLKTFEYYQILFECHCQLEKSNDLLTTLETKQVELDELFKSNHKKKKAQQETLSHIREQLQTLLKLENTFPKNNKESFQIASYKRLDKLIKDFKSYEKNSQAMQVEFQAKFDKKLGYVKTELGNKALTTVIRLCKEAQELVSYCPQSEQDKLNKRLEDQKEELIKLQDWYNFATLPKRKELCEKMEALANKAPQSKIKPLKEEIKALQQEWKELGHARDKEGEAAWKEFQELGNKAYQPIQNLLDRKDQEKQTNLETRKNILETLKSTNNDSKSGEKLLRQSQQNWKRAFPIPAGNNNLQTEFDVLIKSLEENLAPQRNINLGKKNTLLSQAEKLLTLDNIQDAIEQAKQLQQDWKEVGLCENDNELWSKFRQCCDKIFETRDSLRGEAKDKETKAVKLAKSLCKSIESIDKETASEFESELRKLSSQFEEIQDLPKQRKDLAGHFNRAKKSAKNTLKKLKKENQSQEFKDLLSISEQLGKIESTIINEKIDTDSIKNQANAVFEQVTCTTGYQEKLLTSLMALENANTSANKDAFIEKQILALRELCVSLEIELEVESPNQDKALRMELQVKRLNQKFNQGDEDLSTSEKILSAIFLGGLYSYQNPSISNRLITLQEKNTAN
jgi:hypothetical protein